MSTSYTTNAKLRKPALNDTGWDATLNANADLLDAFTAIGGLCVTLVETPSASLNVKVAGGKYQKQDGSVGSYAGTSSQGMTASNTNYLYLTNAGVLTVNTSGFPTTAHVRLASVVAGSSTITSITDERVDRQVLGTDAMPFLPLAGGTMTGAIAMGDNNISAGTTTGVKFGTATSQKIGFFNATPVVQPASANQAAVTLGNANNEIGGLTFSGSYTQAEVEALRDKCEELADDVRNLSTLIHELRTALVNLGLVKGSA